VYDKWRKGKKGIMNLIVNKRKEMIMMTTMHTKNVDLISLISLCYSPALEESNVENGRVVVEKLENKHLKDETVLKFRNGSRKLCKT